MSSKQAKVDLARLLDGGDAVWDADSAVLTFPRKDGSVTYVELRGLLFRIFAGFRIARVFPKSGVVVASLLVETDDVVIGEAKVLTLNYTITPMFLRDPATFIAMMFTSFFTHEVTECVFLDGKRLGEDPHEDGSAKS